jgi:soluble lytic murein transglycosylase-like protein
MIRVSTIRISMFSLSVIAASLIPQAGAHANEAYSGLVQRHAAAHGLPPSLVHRVIMRESRYNPRAVSKGNYGMMQIRLGTARAMGYSGSAAGLLDANTNMTYAVKYLAGAYRAAGGNHDRAVALYASGYGGGGRAARSTVASDMASTPAVGAIGADVPVLSRQARRARGEVVGPRRGARVTTGREQEVR